jgi:nicotinamide mononucleotide adenylyltransferase
MGYVEEKQQQKKELKAQAEAARVANAFQEFFDQNRDIVNCMANEKILRQFFGEDTENISVQTLKDAVEYTSVSQQLARQTEYVERQTLVRYILSNRTMSPETEKHERARLLNEKLTSLDTVREIAGNVRRKKELSKLPVQELKTLARGPEKSWLHPVPPLYQSRSMLLSLASENIQDFRLLVRRCGQAAIDAILAQRDEE